MKNMLAFLFVIFSNTAFGNGYQASYSELERLFDSATIPSLNDFNIDFAPLTHNYLWNSRSTDQVRYGVTIELGSGQETLKYAHIFYPFETSVERAKRQLLNIAQDGRASNLKPNSRNDSLEASQLHNGCLNQYSYRKTMLPNGFAAIVFRDIPSGVTCRDQIAIPSVYGYFILLHAGDNLKTKSQTNVYNGSKVVSQLEAGEVLVLRKLRQDWLSVETANGTAVDGWIKLGDLEAMPKM